MVSVPVPQITQINHFGLNKKVCALKCEFTHRPISFHDMHPVYNRKNDVEHKKT